jgi:hypothetical protein
MFQQKGTSRLAALNFRRAKRTSSGVCSRSLDFSFAMLSALISS